MTRVAALVGPTATGKTEVAVAVAEMLDAEIVSVDSMQAYARLDAGTAKPPRALLERVPHHMLDVFDPAEEVTVAEFQRKARASIAQIETAGKLPLVVGGSGLYFRAVVDDLNFPPRAEAVRARLEEEAERLGPHELYARLERVDPQAADRIEPNNVRRIVRALEVIELTGRPFSDNDSWERYESVYQLAVAGLQHERANLDRRIEERVEQMLRAGLVQEARSLDPTLGRTARQALGYRQVLEASPTENESALQASIVHATKRFARRQESWFRSDPRVVWFDADARDVAIAVAAHFRRALGLA